MSRLRRLFATVLNSKCKGVISWFEEFKSNAKSYLKYNLCIGVP